MAQPDTWLRHETRRREWAPRESGIAPVVQIGATSMSRRLWRLDWSAELPWHFDDARVDAGTSEEAQQFMQEHYGDVFGSPELAGRFMPSVMTDAKRRFFAEMDHFSFRVGREVAGVFMGHPTDWSTYYLRSTAILPKFRERGLMTCFFDRLAPVLQSAGVERIEADVSPMNAAIVKVLSGQGYVVTGSTSSERWGLMLKYTKFLAEDARSTFVRQYTAMKFDKRRNDAALTEERSLP
jgi:hypothetical protein